MGLPKHQEFLIPGLLPAREVSLLGGPSGSGKTRLEVQQILALKDGKPWLGYPTLKTLSLYVACDRGEDSFRRVLDSYGLEEKAFPWISEARIPSIAGLASRPAQIVDWCAGAWPEVRHIVLDGLSSLVDNVNSLKEVSRMFKELKRVLDKRNVALTGLVHATKLKEGGRLLNPRERIVGTLWWGAAAELVSTLDPKDPGNAKDPRRVLSLCSHSGVPNVLELRFDPAGRLLLDDPKEKDLEALDVLLACLGEEGASQEDLWAKMEEVFSPALPRETFREWLQLRQEEGKLERRGAARATRYFKVRPS